MSTVLWGNYLLNGKVVSDETDKTALHKFAHKIDLICQKVHFKNFSKIIDSTDYQFNIGDDELPAGMEGTNELMAQHGVWIEADEAVKMMAAIIQYIEDNHIKFGALKDHSADVIEELKQSLDFAKQAQEQQAKFNFSIVM